MSNTPNLNETEVKQFAEQKVISFLCSQCDQLLINNFKNLKSVHLQEFRIENLKDVWKHLDPPDFINHKDKNLMEVMRIAASYTNRSLITKKGVQAKELTNQVYTINDIYLGENAPITAKNMQSFQLEFHRVLKNHCEKIETYVKTYNEYRLGFALECIDLPYYELKENQCTKSRINFINNIEKGIADAFTEFEHLDYIIMFHIESSIYYDRSILDEALSSCKCT